MMEYECLRGLTPAPFFHWFGVISQIPRGSFKEQRLNAFLLQFAKERDIPCEIDGIGNVLMRVPATRGLEDRPAMLFQAHTDMVWQKDPQVDFDFETQPLRLRVEGNLLTACGTTLGADNGVGVATMLALADGAAAHPPLELLFTVAEEAGLRGIRAFDMTKLKARRMINMDCGDSHVLCVTSAGKISGKIEKTYDLQQPKLRALLLKLSGGIGGHAGLSANLGRACGINLLGDLLLGLPVQLCGMAADSGSIIKAAHAVILVPGSVTEEMLRQRFDRLRTVYAQTDPGWVLEITDTAPEEALSEQDSKALILALSMLRTGQYRSDGNDNRKILTSGTIVACKLENGQLALDYGVRSAYDADQEQLFARCQLFMEALGLELRETDRYCGWPEAANSPLRTQFEQTHRQLFGQEMEIERVHGGIEVGTILGAIPDMDAVGLAPTARGAHTTAERLFIDQVEPFWQLLCAVLAQ